MLKKKTAELNSRRKCPMAKPPSLTTARRSGSESRGVKRDGEGVSKRSVLAPGAGRKAAGSGVDEERETESMF